MIDREKIRVAISNHAVSVLIISAALYIGYQFAVSGFLSGFSDDSATYLLMADIFSPFTESLPDSFYKSYDEVWHLPPGFPLVIALSGANESIYSAHLLVVIEFTLLLAACSVYYSFITASRWAGAVCLVMFLSVPGVWLRLLEIMSEMQYTFISIVILILYCNKKDILDGNRITLLAIGLLLSFLILTRSIGIAMLLALLTWSALNGRIKNLSPVKLAFFSSGLVAPLIIWALLKPGGDPYTSNVLFIFSVDDTSGYVYALLKSNLYSFIDAWLLNTIIYWNESTYLRFSMSILILLASLSGLFIRRNKPDGLYVFFYFGILLVWPYPDEMPRFLLPLMPLLILYAFTGPLYFVKKTIRKKIYFPLIIIAMLSTTSPSLAYINNRHNIASSLPEEDLSYSSQVYFNIDTNSAIHIARTWEMYMHIMKELDSIVRPKEKMLSVKSQFVTYLSHRFTGKLPPYAFENDKKQFLRKVYESGADYVLLTDINSTAHPNGVLIYSEFGEFSEIILRYDYPETDYPALLLLRLDRPSIKEHLGHAQSNQF